MRARLVILLANASLLAAWLGSIAPMSWPDGH
jgi:hypothetical protein